MSSPHNSTSSSLLAPFPHRIVNFTIDITASLYLITIATHPNPPTTTATMTTGLIPNWYPPTRENYDLILSLWKWFPAVRPPFLPLSHPPN